MENKLTEKMRQIVAASQRKAKQRQRSLTTKKQGVRLKRIDIIQR